MHSGHIEVAVAKLINYRIHTIVPNVSWGLGLKHECDMLILDNKGRFTEVEIKTSVSDLKADFKKKHNHVSEIISRLIYAMPIELYNSHGNLIPKNCGIISVRDTPIGYRARWERIVKHNPDKKRPDDKTVKKFFQLGCMRIWSLKEKYYKCQKK
jgi:hypothetical protein